MTHAPFERIIPGASTAVLFVHGILSTPRFWDAFVAATPGNVSVRSLLLPGHGGSVLDFGRVPRGTWRRHVREALDALRATHERVFIVGHSLGTMLAIREAVGNAEKIAGLFLIALPLRIRVKPGAMLHNMLKGVGLAESPETLAQYYGTAQDWRVWRYITWIPRYLELFAECAAARKSLSALRVPTRAFMAAQDELVSPRSCRLLTGHEAVRMTMLPGSSHHEFGDLDRATLLAEYQTMLES